MKSQPGDATKARRRVRPVSERTGIVLEVGTVGGETSGCRPRLVEVRMDSPVRASTSGRKLST